MPTYINRGATVYRVEDNETINRFKTDPDYAAYKEAAGLNPVTPAVTPPPEDPPEEPPEGGEGGEGGDPPGGFEDTGGF